jgi:plastocyanin
LPPTARGLAAGPCKRAALVTAAFSLLLLLVAGCGGDSPAASSAAPSTAEGVGKVTVASDGVQEITLRTQDDYVFTPDHFTVAPGKVRLTVTNVAKQATHNFDFTPDAGPTPIDASIPLLAPGDKKTIDFDVETPGDYPFRCSFHVQLGQVGTMTVRG